LWTLGALCWAPQAWSADFYIEGPAVEERAEAVAMSRAASQAGHRARVERHQVEDGWQFTVRIDGFSDRASAASAAESLEAQLDQKMSVRQGGELESAEAVVSAPRAPAPETLDATVLLGRAVRAHQGTITEVDGAAAILFEFQRRLPDGEIIDHRWVRRGEDRYVALDVVAGEAVSSRTRVVGDKAWLKVGDDAEKPSERIHALEAVSAFEPTEIIPFILVFPSIASERRELQLLQFDGQSELEGTATWMLRYDGDQATGPIALELDAESHRVRRVIFEGGKLAHQFDDYRAGKGGIVVPGRIRTWRDGRLADDVEIRTLDLDPTFDDAWFKRPGSP